MSKAFLIFSCALLALMAGALFYAARLPVQHKDPGASTSAATKAPATAAQPPAIAVDFNPSFTMPDVMGNDRSLSEWQGKHRILNFWATWCAPCRREIPLLKAFQDEQSANGFQVIGIAVDFPEEVSRYAEAAEFNYPVLVGQEDAMAVAEMSGIQFSVLPFTMFIAADGEYLSAYMGELHTEHLARIVEVMTALERGEINTATARERLDRF